MIFVTGDTHGRFNRISQFCDRFKTSKDDTLIILGDAGINYYGDCRDNQSKDFISSLPITLFCVHGNHENRPQNIKSYKEIDYRQQVAYVEPKYPSILFGIDGCIYDFGVKYLVIGGAYSVDKFYRISSGYKWFEDEQPSQDIKHRVEMAVADNHNEVFGVLSHTCPEKYIPTEMFLSCIDQSTVDQSTENWLSKIENELRYKHWLCGHYHTNKCIDKIHFLFDDIIPLPVE